MALMLLLILIQIGAIIALAVIMIQAWWPFVIEFALIHVIVFMLVINRKGTADMKMPWVIVVLALPLVGSLLYAFFANHGLKPKYKKIVKSVNDRAVAKFSLIFDLYYDYSLERVYSEKYIDKIYEGMKNKELFKEFYEEAIRFLKKRCNDDRK